MGDLDPNELCDKIKFRRNHACARDILSVLFFQLPQEIFRAHHIRLRYLQPLAECLVRRTWQLLNWPQDLGSRPHRTALRRERSYLVLQANILRVEDAHPVRILPVFPRLGTRCRHPESRPLLERRLPRQLKQFPWRMGDLLRLHGVHELLCLQELSFEYQFLNAVRHAQKWNSPSLDVVHSGLAA